MFLYQKARPILAILAISILCEASISCDEKTTKRFNPYSYPGYVVVFERKNVKECFDSISPFLATPNDKKGLTINRDFVLSTQKFHRYDQQYRFKIENVETDYYDFTTFIDPSSDTRIMLNINNDNGEFIEVIQAIPEQCKLIASKFRKNVK
jgi:hypothetical protein